MTNTRRMTKMSSDWWSKKLSGDKPATSTNRSFNPVIPPTSGTIRFPQPVIPQPGPDEPQRVLRPDLDSQAQITMGEALRLWKGGEAAKKQGNVTCPDCGSGNVFTRSSRAASTNIQGNSPAPRCFECGWNGMYDQASQTSWGV